MNAAALRQRAKALVAAAAGVAAMLVTVAAPDTTIWKIATVIILIAGIISVHQVPNQPPAGG